MSLEDALEIAEKELSDHPNEDVVFDIFGGEPFLAFDLIPRFCETLWERHPDRNLHFSCITNGTLIDDTIAGLIEPDCILFRPDTEGGGRDGCGE